MFAQSMPVFFSVYGLLVPVSENDYGTFNVCRGGRSYNGVFVCFLWLGHYVMYVVAASTLLYPLHHVFIP